jgi:hypothetical protein
VLKINHARAPLPAWLGDERLHASHRRCLLAKDPAHYGPLFPHDAPTPRGADGKWPYYWPVI